MTDAEKKFQERIRLYKDTVRHKKTDRVLNISIFITWMIYDSGYKLSEALTDYSIMEKVVSGFHEKYQFDWYMDLGMRNPVRIAQAAGYTDYIFNDETYAINFKDVAHMEPDEYDDLRENYYKYMWTKLLPRKFPNLNKELMLKAAAEMLQFSQYTTMITKKFREKYGIPQGLLTTTMAMLPFETLFNFLRGIKGLSIDIRKCPDKVKETCDALGLGPAFEAYKATTQVGTDMTCMPDLVTALLGHTILSVKQFEKYYWPYLKEVFDFVEKYDKILYIFAEGESSRFYEFFREAPKGHVVIHLEMDDIFKAKKEIGDVVCLAGGMPVELLYHGTVKENIDYAKRLIDELAADGGYIFSQNKLVSYPNDCKAENLKAVNDFVREYTL
ncbi:MAG: uroporphyrinogen decarboxylase family protein [Thermacetogeniaceae bacterium]